MTAATLILSLLAQTAAGGTAVCAMIDSAPMASVMQDHQHAHTQHHEERAHHHVAVSDSGEDLDAADDCCANMDAIDCATSGCAAGSGTVILAQSLSAAPVQPHSSLDRERAWLPPYVTPCSDIYRPPTA